jgi:putative ABC transport system permease protein
VTGFASTLDLVHLAGHNLRRHALRSVLTMLGIVFGVASVMAMLAVGAGAQEEILRQIGRLGVKNVIVSSIKPLEEDKATTERQWINRFGLTLRDFRQIEETVPTVARMLPVHVVQDQIWYGSKKLEARLVGVEPEHLSVLPYRLIYGRPLTSIDGEQGHSVCVVRTSLLTQLGAIGDPLSMHLKVGRHYYRIVGVLADETYSTTAEKALGIDPKSHEVYAPYETVIARHGFLTFKRRTGSFEASRVELDQIIVQAAREDAVEPTARMLQTLLAKNHERKDFDIMVPLELLRQSERTRRVFDLVLTLIASISLLVGGIGIMNIMLATVTERTKEIGIRRALGASRGDIVRQFLVETVFLSGIGGIAGLLLGFLSVSWLERFTGWDAVVTPTSVGMAFAVSCLVGIVFGIWPARRAALLDPIAALRNE